MTWEEIDYNRRALNRDISEFGRWFSGRVSEFQESLSRAEANHAEIGREIKRLELSLPKSRVATFNSADYFNLSR